MGKGEIARYKQFLLFPRCFHKSHSSDIKTRALFGKGLKVHLKWEISSIYGRKHCEKKEKLLVRSNFSFSHNVFHSYISLVHQNAVLCGNGLTPWGFHPNYSMICIQTPVTSFMFNFFFFHVFLNPFPND